MCGAERVLLLQRELEKLYRGHLRVTGGACAARTPSSRGQRKSVVYRSVS